MSEQSNWDAVIEGLIEDAIKAEDEVEKLAKEIKEKQASKKKADQTIERARKDILSMLTEAGVTSSEHDMADLQVSKGRVVLVTEDDADPEKLPIDLVEIKKVPNKSAISEELAAGRKVPGFHLSTTSPTLSIKRRKKARAKS
jgi:DNA polymerase II small subunit/DNA polymerase delta subunit B